MNKLGFVGFFLFFVVCLFWVFLKNYAFHTIL